jgi:peptidylprolyl isomerase/FKBP-type peptidyl-prolyl cis-trans isomerase FklB
MRTLIAALCALALLPSLSACGSPKKSQQAEAAAGANLTAGQAFLATNAKAEGVHVLPSGLQYKVVATGPADGLRPKPQDEVKVHYEGKLLNGHVFDSSFARGQPAAFPLEGLIPGWVEALQLMRPGDEWMLYVPANLAYGDKDMGGGEIPANSTLIFRIQLIAVLPHEGSIQRG